MEKGKVLIVVGIIIVLLLTFYLMNKDSSNKVCIEDNCFIVEVVSSGPEREQGLMYRESLDKNKGMLFIFDNEGSYPFWMKNTLIPLDMIWINSEGVIVDIREAIPCEADPCLIYSHAGSAKYVLEINKGLSSELEIEIGQIAKSNLIV